MKIIKAISSSIKDPIIEEIKKSPFLGIEVDASKDITGHEIFFLNIRYINS